MICMISDTTSVLFEILQIKSKEHIMGLGMRMSLQISQSLRLRQEMEMTLSQNLRQSLTLELVQLLVYKKREEELTKLYRLALSHGMVRRYEKHGMTFEYALVAAKDVPAVVQASGDFAFSHCLFSGWDALFFGTQYALARGSWLLFVVHDHYPDMPERFIEYAAVHERGEQVTLGNHNLASKLEFAIARKEGKLVEYMAWLEEQCPGKFADVFSNQISLELPDEEEFQAVLETFSSSEEATRTRQMIEDFEWPYRLLQKLTLYNKRNDDAATIVMQALRTAEILVEGTGIPLKELVSRITSEVARLLHRIKERDLERYLSYSRLGKVWHDELVRVDQRFVEMLGARQRVDPDYVQTLIDAGVVNGLPKEGVLSFSFAEALQAA